MRKCSPASPYHLILARTVLAQKAEQENSLSIRMREGLLAQTGIAKSAHDTFYMNTDWEFSAGKLDQLAKALQIKLSSKDNIRLVYHSWDELIEKENQFLTATDLDKVAHAQKLGNLRMPKELASCMEDLVKRRVAALLAAPTATVSAFQMMAPPIVEPGYPTKGKHFNKELSELMGKQIGFFALDFNSPDLEITYEQAEKGLVNKIIHVLSEWNRTISRHPNPCRLVVNGQEYVMTCQPELERLIIKFTNDTYRSHSLERYDTRRLTRTINAVGKIREVIMEVPDFPESVIHFERFWTPCQITCITSIFISNVP